MSRSILDDCWIKMEQICLHEKWDAILLKEKYRMNEWMKDELVLTICLIKFVRASEISLA